MILENQNKTFYGQPISGNDAIFQNSSFPACRQGRVDRYSSFHKFIENEVAAMNRACELTEGKLQGFNRYFNIKTSLCIFVSSQCDFVV